LAAVIMGPNMLPLSAGTHTSAATL
jgi:hypothetical protein